MLSLIDALATDWKDVLHTLITEEEDKKIMHAIQEDEADDFEIFPKREHILEAFNYFHTKDIKVVIISQDPYHTKGAAHGLCFSVPRDHKMPPSLRNIFKELHREYGIERKEPCLTDWAHQGVLLLNRALTVRQASPNSHAHLWHAITGRCIQWISANSENVVFMLWGNEAKKCKEYIDVQKHLILEHTHPSPLSRQPFFGNRHFGLCDSYLTDNGKTSITWV